MIGAVIDVNVLVSALIGPLGFSRRLIHAWQEDQFDLLISDGISAELDQKLRLPRMSKWLRNPETNRQWILQLLQTQARMVIVPPHECQIVAGDPEDDYVLATSRLGRARCLVTGDKKLLELKEYAGTRIVSPREFLTVIQPE